MKTRIALLSTLIAAPLLLTATPARSACTGESGYVYVWDSCVTETYHRASSPCHRENDERTKSVYIISNVIWDGPERTRDWPSVRFANAYARSTGGDSVSSNYSACFQSRAEAEDKRESAIAYRMRHGSTIYHVHISE